MTVVTPTILSAGKAMDPTFELLSIDITKEINRVPYAQLVLLDGSIPEQTFPISDDVFFEPGKEIEIKLRYEGEEDVSVFKGFVVGQGVRADASGSLLTVEMKDAAIKMTTTRKSMVHREQTDDKVIKALISNNGLKAGTVAATKVTHPQLVQYNATDWDFMLSRADANGLLTVVNDGEVACSEIKITGSPKHTFEFGIDPIYNFEIDANAGRQYPEIESTGWDLKTQKMAKPAKAAPFKLSQGDLDGKKIAGTLGVEQALLKSAVPLDPAELQAWSDARMATTRMSMLKGRISLPGDGAIQLMDVIEVAGIGNRFNGSTLVTGIRHRLSVGGWQTDLQFGLSADRFADRTGLVDAPASGLLPAVNGLQVGVVDAFEDDPDKEFRVKVILPGIDEADGSVWARLATPDGGVERGYFFRPETGDEVVVGFFNDDPRQPVILGAMFGSTNKPPASVATLDDKNINKAIVTKSGITIGFVDDEKAIVFIETPGGNKITLDDDGEMIELADLNGNTITMSADGVVIKSTKDFIVDASGNVEIKGSAVDLK